MPKWVNLLYWESSKTVNTFWTSISQQQKGHRNNSWAFFNSPSSVDLKNVFDFVIWPVFKRVIAKLVLEDKDKEYILEYKNYVHRYYHNQTRLTISYHLILIWDDKLGHSGPLGGGIGKKIDFQKRGPNFMFAYILNRKWEDFVI